MMLLQIDTADLAVEDQSVTLIDLMLKGGFWMIPILLLSVVAVIIFVERFLTLRKAGETPDHFTDDIRAKVLAGDVNGAKMICAQTGTPVARMIEKGLSRLGSPLKNIEVSIENVGKIEIYKLEKNLGVLATISGAAPMIGFLGTVTGMIQAFIAIAQEEGSVSPKLLSSGIYEAMVTTAAGLTVGIIAYLGYNYLVTRMQKVIHRMEYSAIEFIDLLQEPK
ncbi:MAG: MotA/TolQ/ExbB proton channel family protein [Imperialibacter sp.]|jgi:biopolymer transport protein ExbB|uniref:MotA/TolQ/ExbB proton channel family protein n=1 Tax=unclassified Imperialibacter TaxID=2629706 RepID=UPI00125A1007|nr:MULTISPECIES: MotA/TolQ/ExbB proton channel family protein [unclassified Imperialibacter]CAD5278077.1 Biopolymer transporter ExbB [Imperialibacter sp. 75]CAD5295861.1 Biopolymer transporter ExbB [Imperialibacter sp. 89]VVT11711.1 Biopolymer transporter ExbB [Imperialibacter sp. EC-SDR9]|tara:strand:+ start:3108 stop:3773 length:666 start_codon:yes stop_codon:yes gene_type:complete